MTALPPVQPELDPTRPPPAEYLPDYTQIITEDDTPVDNLFSEKQQRLLTEPLYSSWVSPTVGRTFLATANVGLFYIVREPALVPDVLLSLGVEAPADVWSKPHRSYFVWEFGKPPDVVIEIVSNREGGEAERKLQLYAQIGVSYYVIFDPLNQLDGGVLRIFELRGRRYVALEDGWLPEVELGLQLWPGAYENLEATWLRWCDAQGLPIPTGAELAEAAAAQAEAERQRAESAAAQAEAERQRAEQAEQQRESERQRAEQAEQQRESERQRAERLVAQLRALGIAPAEE